MDDALTFAFLGLGFGAIYALLGMAVVVTYRGSGVLNFAQSAIGVFGVFLAFHLNMDHWRLFVALPLGLLVSAALAALFQVIVMRHLVRAALTTRIVATLGLMIGLIGFGNLVFEPTGAALSVPSVLPIRTVRLGPGIFVGTDKLIILGLACLTCIALIVVGRMTRFGLATSAVAQDRTLAASMGWSPDFIASANWAVGALVAAIGIFLVAPISGLDVTSLSMLIVPAMACALLGRFESFGLTLVGGLAVGVCQSEIGRYVSNPGWSTAVPLLAIILILVARGRRIPSKSELSERTAGVGPGHIGWFAVLWVIGMLALIPVVSLNWITSITITLLFGLITLSVTLVTGFTGQLSLVQLSLAGLGAFGTSFIVAKTSLPMSFAIVLGAVGAAAIGVIISIPALRTRGSNLAIVSLGLASVIDALVLNNPTAAAAVAETAMPPLRLFGISFYSFDHPRRFAFLALLAFVIGLAITSSIRRRAVGRRLLAVRANERAAMSLGVSVSGAKVLAFALGALLAGFAGALLEAELSYADFTIFTVLGSIEVVLNSVLGGIGWPSGAWVAGGLTSGGVGSQALGLVVTPGNWLLVISGVGTLLVVLQSGNGLIPLWISQVRWLEGAVRRRRRALHQVPTPRNDSPAGYGDFPLSGAGFQGVCVRGIRVQFGSQVALDGVDLEVRPAEILGVIGPNGAGKSTLIDVISGFERQTAGSVELDNRRIDSMSPVQRARLGIGRTFQSLELFEDMTIGDNLAVASDSRLHSLNLHGPFRHKQRTFAPAVQAAIRHFGLEDHLGNLPSDLDHARRSWVAIARVLATSPRLLMLDEPAAGMDARGRAELGRALRKLADTSRIGVLLIEHDIEFVFSFCDRVVVMDMGEIICSGDPAEVRENPRLIAAYLGAASADDAMAPGERPADANPS